MFLEILKKGLAVDFLSNPEPLHWARRSGSRRVSRTLSSPGFEMCAELAEVQPSNTNPEALEGW